MFQIGLLDPGSKKLTEPMPHIGLAYVAAFLEKEGCSVRVLDTAVATADEKQSFLNTSFDLLGITVTSFTFRDALQLAKEIKTIHPEQRIVLGGPHTTIDKDDVLKDFTFDYAIYGEGEITMSMLAKTLAEFRVPSTEVLKEINGLIFRDGSDIIVNPPRQRIQDLNTLPFPAYHLFPMDRYEVYPLLISRGCPFDCAFCAAHVIWGRKWRGREAHNVIEEIKYLFTHFGEKMVAVCDDTFNANIKRAKIFCEMLIESKLPIRWSSWSFRADLADPTLLKLMKQSGCESVSIGIESADPQVLQNIHKRETIEEIAQGIRRIQEAELLVTGLFMIGNPGDTLETIKKSINFAATMKLDNADFFLALPYPKTELWQYAQEKSRMLKTDYTTFHHFSDEPVFETTEFPAADRQRAYQMARRFSLTNRLKRSLVRKLRYRLKEGRYRNPQLLIHDMRKLFKTVSDLVLWRIPRI
ncbi:radical SAM protein [Thioploca ingrica]|uniref:Radical SAM protein n=1 Tax=Thioploca ingrica TaxID=40754 RepID=A0A090AEY9_9GAMM|nr:radical SAM protein [Thioploca ingrica]